MLKKGLLPIIDKNTKILILGSLPGDVSIKKQQYYSNSNNDFWKILGNILNIQFSDNYDERIKCLLEKGIGLWDVYNYGNRVGSMDKDINNYGLNDFESIKNNYSNIKLICFNGKEAGRSEEILQKLGFKTKVLLSSSGPNRSLQKQRLEQWSSIFK